MKSDYGKSASEGWSMDYEKAWLRAHGKKCPKCKGTGQIGKEIVKYGQSIGFKECPHCNGVGFIEKEQKK